MAETLELAELLRGAAGSELESCLREIRRHAGETGEQIWLTGGTLRDLLLGRPTRDIDLIVPGPPGPRALGLAGVMGGEVVEHASFLTATLRLASGLAVDLVQARREVYAVPGKMPAVFPAGLAEDLLRRDFSVNAMALSLLPGVQELIDPTGGRSDLGAGVLKTLHPGSFVDDPTRILRGARQAVELGFRFDAATKASVSKPEVRTSTTRVSGGRLWRELERSLPDAGTALEFFRLLGSLGWLETLLGGDSFKRPSEDPGLAQRLRNVAPAVDGTRRERTVAYLAAWVAPAPGATRRELAVRLALDPGALE